MHDSMVVDHVDEQRSLADSKLAKYFEAAVKFQSSDGSCVRGTCRSCA
ncbi:MAG: hypothetical protein R3C45_05915 [Phycisphaerales bacterium]